MMSKKPAQANATVASSVAVPASNTVIISRSILEELVNVIVQWNAIDYKNQTNWTSAEKQHEKDTWQGIEDALNKLLKHCTRSEDTVKEVYEKGIAMAQEMMDGTATQPQVRDLMKVILTMMTRGKGSDGQQVPGGLMEEEKALPRGQKEFLVFYRGVRVGFYRLEHTGVAGQKHTIGVLVESLWRLNTNSYTPETQEQHSERMDECRIAVNSQRLLSRSIKTEDTLNDIFEKGIATAKIMADTLVSYPNSEKFVKIHLKRLTMGQGIYGQKIPFGLLEEELELPKDKQQELVFYRGMRKELQRMKKQSVKEAAIAAPDPIHPKAREYLETIVQTLVKLNTSSSYTSPGDRLQVYDHLRVSIAFDKLPRLHAQPSDTLNDFLERGKSMAADMADVVAAHPNSESFVKDYLKKETTGQGIYGQEVDNGLLEEERELPELKQQQLVFYRGMRKELQRLSKLKSTQ